MHRYILVTVAAELLQFSRGCNCTNRQWYQSRLNYSEIVERERERVESRERERVYREIVERVTERKRVEKENQKKSRER